MSILGVGLLNYASDTRSRLCLHNIQHLRQAIYRALVQTPITARKEVDLAQGLKSGVSSRVKPSKMKGLSILSIEHKGGHIIPFINQRCSNYIT